MPTISVGAGGESRTRVFFDAFIDVVTRDTVSVKSWATGAFETSFSVKASSVFVTIMSSNGALVDVKTRDTITLESFIASAWEWPFILRSKLNSYTVETLNFRGMEWIQKNQSIWNISNLDDKNLIRITSYQIPSIWITQLFQTFIQ